MPTRPRNALFAGSLLAAILAACATSVPTASPEPSPTATASPSATPRNTPSPPASDSPSPTATASPPATEPVIVTFLVADEEEYRVRLTEPRDIEIARRLLSGEEEFATIPNGRIVRGGDGGVNTGYAWHIDPEDFEFAEITTEVCDGLPSYVENGTLSGDRFCPWSAEVVEIRPAG